MNAYLKLKCAVCKQELNSDFDNHSNLMVEPCESCVSTIESAEDEHEHEEEIRNELEVKRQHERSVRIEDIETALKALKELNG